MRLFFPLLPIIYSLFSFQVFASQTATASLGAALPETFASQTATASLGAASPETFASQTGRTKLAEVLL
jgi:hypothetical protein